MLDARSPEAYGGLISPGLSMSGSVRRFPRGPGRCFPTMRACCWCLMSPGSCGRPPGSCCASAIRCPLGWLRGGTTAWRTAAKPIEETLQITVHELNEELARGEVELLDVRQPSEWVGGHVPSAHYITGAELPERLDEVPDGKLVA